MPKKQLDKYIKSKIEDIVLKQNYDNHTSNFNYVELP